MNIGPMIGCAAVLASSAVTVLVVVALVRWAT